MKQCSVCENGRPTVLSGRDETGETRHQVVCLTCGTGTAKKNTPDAAKQAWRRGDVEKALTAVEAAAHRKRMATNGMK